MDIITTTTSIRKRITLAIVTAAATVAAGGVAAAQADPPPFEQCAYRDHPVGADVGGLLPTNFVPPTEMQAALRGEIAVGTDCAIYDLPV